MSAAERRKQSESDTREKMVVAAIRLFAEKGVEGVSLRAVGKEAGQRNTAAVQYHFGSREGLLRAALEQILKVLEVEDAKEREEVDSFRESLQLTPVATLLWDEVMPLLMLPERVEWGAEGSKLMARVVMGEVPAMAEMLERLTASSQTAFLRKLSSLCPHVPLSILETRLDLVYMTVICSEASSYTNERLSEQDIGQQLLILLEFLAGGLNAPVR